MRFTLDARCLARASAIKPTTKVACPLGATS